MIVRCSLRLTEDGEPGPGFIKSLIGQRFPVNAFNESYPGWIVSAKLVGDGQGPRGIEVEVEFDAPAEIFGSVGLDHLSVIK